MKKVISVFLLIVTLCSCSKLFYDYDGWQTVTIEDFGSFKFPPDWKCFYHDNIFYVIDENEALIAFSSGSYLSGNKDENGVESNMYFDEIQYLDLLGGTIFSNGANYGPGQIIADDNEKEVLYITVHNYNSDSFKLIFWHETVTEDIVAKIAWSYLREMNE